jgi:hypothetical protein
VKLLNETRKSPSPTDGIENHGIERWFSWITGLTYYKSVIINFTFELLQSLTQPDVKQLPIPPL